MFYSRDNRSADSAMSRLASDALEIRKLDLNLVIAPTPKRVQCTCM